MTNRSRKNRHAGVGRKGGWRLTLLGLMLLGVGLGLGRGISAHDEGGLASLTRYPARDYAVVWGPRSFDEALWEAIAWIAILKDSVALHEDRFSVQLRYAGGSDAPITVTFNREDLNLLIEGRLAPASFIRDHVEFR